MVWPSRPAHGIVVVGSGDGDDGDDGAGVAPVPLAVVLAAGAGDVAGAVDGVPPPTLAADEVVGVEGSGKASGVPAADVVGVSAPPDRRS